MHRQDFLAARIVVFLLLVQTTSALNAQQPVSFNRDIRPIMSDTCFRCHGPDKNARMAELRLDIREEALKATKSGAVPIVPGDPEKSAIVQRVFATDARIMPPKYAHKELTPAQKDTIRRWVVEGAKYEGHWSYEPVRRPPVPGAPSDASTPVRNPIDAFIRARLAREGLQASPEADKRTLLRRVSFDLTGLPPTPEEVEQFLSDASPDAYEKVVERLLSSPRYAEMQTLRWLDAVRYADSAGFHGDNLWPVWPFRDYVLRAFQRNMPFDQFTREQIAGDLLPNATIDQKIAATYNRLNRVSSEGGLQPKEYLDKYGADRVRTTSTVWLGATMGCAECHDHKFDPFTAKDFYSFKAFFADIRETGRILDRGERAWGSLLPLPSEEQSARLNELNRQLEAARAELDKKALSLDERRWDWEDELLAKYENGELAWHYQRPVSAQSANGAKLTIYNDELVESNFYLNGSLAYERKRGDGLVVASGPDPDNETYTVQFKPGQGSWTALGIDVFQDESLPGNRLARGADRYVLTEVDAEILPGANQAARKLVFVLATSTQSLEPPENGAMLAIDGNSKTGWAGGLGESRNPFLALRFAERVSTTAESIITVRLRHDSELRRATIGRFRLALSSAEHSWPELGESRSKSRVKKPDPEASTLSMAVERGLPPDVLKALQTREEARNEEQHQLVQRHFQWAAPELQPLMIRVAQLEAERNHLEATIPRILLTERVRPRITRVLARGNFLDESGEIVEPAIPAVFGKVGTPGRRTTRLHLANWIASRDNPLTARVFVNRLWRQFFGTGLSKTLEDFGSQGEMPSHLDLLDWLAVEFMQPAFKAEGTHAWDVKHMIRTIVTSHTYRQSSLSTPQLEEKDPENRLLARQSRFRVDAEIVRDTALAVSGLLVEKLGGPSVRPYQPKGYLAAMNFPKREYSASRGEDLYRRSVYTEWRRTFLHPTLLTFDAPTREECSVNRTNSNTPLQALVALNDPIFVEAARVFAQNILTSGASDLDQQLDWAFMRALSRKPSREERDILSGLYKKNLARFQADAGSAAELLTVGEAPLAADMEKAELAALTTVTRAILNLNETITRN